MIHVDDLSISAGAFSLTGVSFTVPTSAYAVLMGASGCGKTTLLEAICGLRRIGGGRISLLGRDVTRLKPAARGVAYVPQDRALFNSMSVWENLAFALQLRKADRPAIQQRVDELADVLDIRALLSRKPAALSGGESQRVALGRALAARPEILLLDEPLSALDDQNRAQMHRLLNSTCRQSGATVLHVTHSSHDADQLADVVLRMEEGRIRSGA